MSAETSTCESSELTAEQRKLVISWREEELLHLGGVEEVECSYTISCPIGPFAVGDTVSLSELRKWKKDGVWPTPLLFGNGSLPTHSPTSVNGISRIIELASRVLPDRIIDEELGDAQEDIHRRIERGDPAWRVYFRALSAVAWACLNSLRYALTARARRGA